MSEAKKARFLSQTTVPDARSWRQKCRSNRRDGQPCNRWAIRGGVVCPKHGGTIPRVRAKANRVMQAVRDGAELSVMDLTMDRHDAATRLKAARQLWKWAGVHPLSPAARRSLGLDDENEDSVEVEALLRKMTG
jgi:hypothetical protein